MLTTNLKRAALAMLLATAGGMSANAQIENAQIEGQVQVVVDGEVQVTPATAATPIQLDLPPTGISQVITWNEQAPAPFWIGVEAQPIDEATRAALGLDEKHGILVARVTEESPAAKAGLKAGDILLQWNDSEQKGQPIKSVEHLVKLVQESGTKQPGQAVKLEYRRRGKTDTVEVTPAKRAEAAQTITWNTGKPGINEHTRHQQSAMQEQLKRLQAQRESAKQKFEEVKKAGEGKSGKDAQANLAKAEKQLKMLDAQIKEAQAQLKQFEVWTKAMQANGFQLPGQGNANFDVLIPAPGIVTTPPSSFPLNAQALIPGHSLMKSPEWPENLSVTMKRQGNKPAEFVIKRGEDKWEVTSETLKELPPEVRTLIEPLAEPQKSRMMRLWTTSGDEGPGRVELRNPEQGPPMQAMPLNPPRVVIHATPQNLNPPAPVATQKQIEELQKAIELLRRQVEQMEKK